ncbi:MAG: nicotinate phosphoribosyltransferase [Cyclonatronaceae bacterium]
MYDIKRDIALYVDMYELTMAQGYYLSGKHTETATFDYFFRSNPFDGAFVVFAGIGTLLPLLYDMRFHDDHLQYLKSLGFKDEFLSYLSGYRFTADLEAAREGEIVFPNEPVIRVTGPLIEAQIVETLLLNIVNFESLIATKAARLRIAAGDRKLMEFGLRRAQGFGGINASRAAIIGGLDSTSNVQTGFYFDARVDGTQAHSWVQSFDHELQAFRTYAEHYPDKCILLVDTYNTLESGVPNAIQVARELEKKGHKLVGIRLDSGDLAYLSKRARNMLDDAGFGYVKIAASNQLDEYLIKSLLEQEAPIDVFGVGTRLATGYQTPALDGVYKLSMINDQPKLKVSNNIEKVNLPGLKQVHRYFNGQGQFYGDGVLLDDSESKIDTIYHPHQPLKKSDVSAFAFEQLLHPAMSNGDITREMATVSETARYVTARIDALPVEHKRFYYPHVYKVGISSGLSALRQQLIERALNNP